MPITPTRLRIKDLTVLNQEADLVNKNFEVENPTGSPTDQNYQVSFATVVQAVSNNLPGPNDSKSLVKAARVYDSSSGSPGDSTLVGLNPDFLCLYALCYVEFPHPSRTYRLVYSSNGPLQVWRDPTFTGQKIGAQWVEVNSLEENASAIDTFSPFATQYNQGAVVKFTTGGRLRIFSAKSLLVKSTFANNQIPTPIGDAADASWQEINPVGATANVRDFLPGAYKRDDLVVFTHKLYRAKQDIVIGDFNDGSGNYDNFPDQDYWEIVGDGAAVSNPYDDAPLTTRVVALEGATQYLAETLGENYNELSGRIDAQRSTVPEWAAGPYVKGQFVLSGGSLYIAKQAIQNSQVAPATTNAYWLKVTGAAEVQNSLTPASTTISPSVDAVNSGLTDVLTAVNVEKNRIDNLVNGAPQALDTLAEIAAQLAVDEAGAAAILATQNQHTQQIAGNTATLTTKADLVNGVVLAAQLPTASATGRGVIKVGTGLAVDGSGSLSLAAFLRTTVDSIYLGYLAAPNDGGTQNIFIGREAGFGIQFGSYNSVLGYQAGYKLLNGNHNTLFGYQTGYNLTSGTRNTFFGNLSGYYASTASNNVGFGYNAGFNLTTGVDNVFIGNLAAQRLGAGNFNTVSGSRASFFLTTGNYNVTYGYQAGYSLGASNGNVAIGANAGFNTTADNNTFVGTQAGYNNGTGTNNSALGYNAGPETAALNNTTAVGANTKTTTSDTIILGDTTNTALNVGIGTQTPTSKLQVAGVIHSSAGGIKFPDGTIQTTAGTGAAADVNKAYVDGQVAALQTQITAINAGLADKMVSVYRGQCGLNTFTNLGFGPNVTGGGQGRTFALTSVFAKQDRTGLISTATAGSTACLRMNKNMSLADPFELNMKFGNSDASNLTAPRCFYGLSGSATSLSAVDPVSLTDVIGIGSDGPDGNFFIYSNDASGVATKIDLGSNFNSRSLSVDYYNFKLSYNPAVTAGVVWSVTNLTNGAMAAGVLTTDIPATTTTLGIQVYRNNGNQAVAVGVDLGVISLSKPY